MEATDEIYFLVNMILPLTVFGTRPVTHFPPGILMKSSEPV